MPERPSRHQRGLDSKWVALRNWHIRQEPLCRMCAQHGLSVPAEHVDHIVPRAKAPERRLDPTNLQSLCAACHNGPKRADEARGYSTAIGVDGWPVDPNHPTMLQRSK